MIDIISYIDSLKTKDITSDVKAELLKIHENYYRLIDLIDKKLQVPRVRPQDRIN
jgi:hypothetical protein